jgi:hypothetical protein
MPVPNDVAFLRKSLFEVFSFSNAKTHRGAFEEIFSLSYYVIHEIVHALDPQFQAALGGDTFQVFIPEISCCVACRGSTARSNENY